MSQAPVWQSDEDAPNCTRCNREFTFFFRRHHCRGCGKVMCGDCTNKKCKLPKEFGYNGEERVCEACFDYLGAKHSEDNFKVVDMEEVRNRLITHCKEVAENPDQGWKVLGVKDGVEIATKVTIIDGVESPFNAVRTKKIIKADFEKTKKMCFDPSLWKEWSSDLKDSKLIQKINEYMEVWFEEYKLPVVEDRHICTLKIKYDGTYFKSEDQDPSKTFTLLACSVPHPECPKVQGVRGRLNYSITTLNGKVQDGQEVTEFVAYGHFDPSGLLPPMLVNKLLSEAGNNIHLMAQYIEKH